MLLVNSICHLLPMHYLGLRELMLTSQVRKLGTGHVLSVAYTVETQLRHILHSNLQLTNFIILEFAI